MLKGKKGKRVSPKKEDEKKESDRYHGEEKEISTRESLPLSERSSRHPGKRKIITGRVRRQSDTERGFLKCTVEEVSEESLRGLGGEQEKKKKKKKRERKESVQAEEEDERDEHEEREEENDSPTEEEEEEEENEEEVNPWLLAGGKEPEQDQSAEEEDEEEEEEAERAWGYSNRGTSDVMDILSRREGKSSLGAREGKQKKKKKKGGQGGGGKENKDAEDICALMNRLTSGSWEDNSKSEGLGGEDDETESDSGDEEEEEGEDSSSPSGLFRAFQDLRRQEDEEAEDEGERGLFDGVTENNLSLLKVSRPKAKSAAQGYRHKKDGDVEIDARTDDIDAENDLSFSSLLQSLNSTDSLHLTSLRKQLEALSAPPKLLPLSTAPTSTSADPADSSSSSSPPPAPALPSSSSPSSSASSSSSSAGVILSSYSDDVVKEPLPRSKEELATRLVQYDHATRDIRKWTGLVQRNAQAIQLQLGGPPEDLNLKVRSINQVVSEFEPKDDFEEALLAAVRADGLDDAALKQSGVLAPADPIKRQLEQRQVARLKFLLFSEQRRARRIKKIKSKVGRKKRKQVEQREEEKIMERLEVENPTLAEELRRKFEEKRAKMRLLRQQNARSKWATLAARFGGRDMQREISRQKQREVDEKRTVERLAKGRGISDSEGSDSSDSDDGEEGGEEEDYKRLSPGEKARLLQRLAKETSAETSEPLPEKGLLALPFMRRAIEKKRERNRKEVEKLQRRSRDGGGGEEEEDDEDSEEEEEEEREERRERRGGNGTADDSDLESQPDEMDEANNSAGGRENGREEEEEGTKKNERGRMRSVVRKKSMDRRNVSDQLDPDAVRRAESELEGLWHHFELKGEDGDEEKERQDLGEEMEKEKKTRKGEEREKEEEGAEQGGGGGGRRGFFKSPASAKSFFKEVLKAEERAREEREKKRRREKIEEEARRERERAKKDSRNMRDERTVEVESENPWLVASSGKNKKRRKGGDAKQTSPLSQTVLNGGGGGDGEDAEEAPSGRSLLSLLPSSSSSSSASLLTPQEQLDELLRREDEAAAAAEGSDESDDADQLGGNSSRLPETERPGAAGADHAGGEKKNKKKKTENISQQREMQKELIQQAFVCDSDVEEEFYQDQLKEQEEGNEAKNGGDPNHSGALPGWGSWHGPGIRAWKKKSVADQQKAGSPGDAGKTGGEEKNKRVKRPCVVVNQQLDRKAAKYFVSELPHPYKAPEQYEATLKHPTGPEWNTASMHARLIAPKINVRVGAVIPPLQFARRHLGAAQRDAILEAWDSKATRRQRTKTRF